MLGLLGGIALTMRPRAGGISRKCSKAVDPQLWCRRKPTVGAAFTVCFPAQSRC